ncbi:MAG: esterase-like activity of phytase family protein, partial [Flavisolibacter sp.]
MDFLRLMKVCLVASFVFSCTSAKKTIVDSSKTQLHLLGMYTLPFNLQFKNTTIGGLSGIDYDTSHDLYYIISDDRSAINPARFYKARIALSDKGIDSVQFVDVDFMLQPGGNNYPDAKQDALHVPDPESLRFNPATNELLWTSEGERIVRKADTILSDPSIMLMNTEGRFIDSFILPGNVHMKASQQGPRQNGVFEGSTFVKNQSRLLVSIEEPLYEDGPRAGLNDSAAVLRILEFDVKDRKPLAQYAYRADAVAHPPHPPGSFR